jgi:aspartyl-tRNA(Asn)/glutamyl-tRNA(Gln) amidotransferase subunit A
MHNLKLCELINGLHKRDFSSQELTAHYLGRINKNKTLNAFISLDEEHALKTSAHADQLLQKGQGKRLTGIPMAHKDIFCTKRMPTTCGSKMLANFHSPYNATVVEKLDLEGAILLGKTNMDEFAMGSSNETSHFGPVQNPWNLAHVPGGSSGGSASAVAASLIPFATGSDTGGSVRQPAAFCGISGMKPTYGLVSRYGMVAYASSLDQAGIFAPSVEDLSIVLEAIAGFDPLDSTSANRNIPHYFSQLNQSIDSMKIGLPSCFFNKDLTEDIQHALEEAIKIFEKAGAHIVPIKLSLQDLWLPCYYILACAEASSNLSRYDGIRFGYRTSSAKTLEELIKRSRQEGFGVEVKRRILTGTHVLSSGYFDDYFVKAQKIRRMIQNELLDAFNTVDVILGPTTPSTAFKIGEKQSPTQSYLADIFTVPANLAGLPAISLPAGLSQGLPIGLQLTASHFNEISLFALGHYYQQVTTWHQQKPDAIRGEK